MVDAKAPELRRIVKRLDKAIADLNSIRSLLHESIASKRTKASTRPSKTSTEPTPDPGELKTTYEHLLKEYERMGPLAVNRFVLGRTSKYLDAFISANGLPIPTQRGKQKIEEELRRLIVQSLLIRGRENR